jgi:hypothetical protein
MGIDPIAGATSDAGAGAGAIDGSMMGFFILSMWERGESAAVSSSALHIPWAISFPGKDGRLAGGSRYGVEYFW